MKKRNRSWVETPGGVAAVLNRYDRQQQNAKPESGNGNGDAQTLRAAEPGSAEYDYLHRYDSPDNRRDSMG